MVTWGRDAATVSGHNQMRAIGVCPVDNRAAVPCPLALSVDVAPVVHHNFRAEPSCTFPVTLRLTNLLTSHDAPMDFVIEVARESFEVESSLTWLGSGICTVNELKASEEVELSLSACCDVPGIYQLNRFTVRLPDGRLFAFPTQAIVEILSQS